MHAYLCDIISHSIASLANGCLRSWCQIDFVAIVPFYIEVILADVQIPGLQVLRLMRLVRIFRLMKISQGSLRIFSGTISKSLQPLYMLMFLTSIAMLISASIIYYTERGRYDPTLNVWMRPIGYLCPVRSSGNHAMCGLTLIAAPQSQCLCVGELYGCELHDVR